MKVHLLSMYVPTYVPILLQIGSICIRLKLKTIGIWDSVLTQSPLISCNYNDYEVWFFLWKYVYLECLPVFYEKIVKTKVPMYLGEFLSAFSNRK